eukprot:scaffold1878_cov113-Isochrysis_galbana.AAC.8
MGCEIEHSHLFPISRARLGRGRDVTRLWAGDIDWSHKKCADQAAQSAGSHFFHWVCRTSPL